MKTRILKTGIYTDECMLQETPDVKFICVYLYTNSHISLTDTYKVHLRVMQLETGYDSSTLKLVIDKLQSYGIIKHKDYLWYKLLKQDFAGLLYSGGKNDNAIEKYELEIPNEIKDLFDISNNNNNYQQRSIRKTPFSKEKRIKLLDELGRECNNCKAIDCYFEIDHILPVVDGGSDDIENLQVLCHKCHIIKTSNENITRNDTTIGVVSEKDYSTYKSEIINNKSEIKNHKSKYGEFEKVSLTDDEYNKLIEKLGEKETKQQIRQLDEYIASKGKRYSSHYATILSWSRRKLEDTNQKKMYVAD